MQDRKAFGELITDEANSPGGWINRADDLIDAAGVLLEASAPGYALITKSNLTDAEVKLILKGGSRRLRALMLYAFAVECLCKAHFLAQTPSGEGQVLYSDGKLKGLGVHPSHDLQKIAQATGVAPSLAEREFSILDKLTVMTELGRYPAAAHVDRYYLSEPTGPHPSQQMRSIWIGSDDRLLLSAFLTIYGLLTKTAPDELQILAARTKP